MTDGDYMQCMLHVVLPMAHQFQPDMVVVSAGFDGADGDFFGRCAYKGVLQACDTRFCIPVKEKQPLATNGCTPYVSSCYDAAFFQATEHTCVLPSSI